MFIECFVIGALVVCIANAISSACTPNSHPNGYVIPKVERVVEIQPNRQSVAPIISDGGWYGREARKRATIIPVVKIELPRSRTVYPPSKETGKHIESGSIISHITITLKVM